MSRVVKLKAPQIIRLFGWWDLKPYLSWDDVRASGSMTFRSLRASGLTSAQLYVLQPDGDMWKRHGGLVLNDCHEMTQWPLHPSRDLGAELGHIIDEQWTPEQMARVGVDLQELTRLRMEPRNMALFGYPLTSWIHLGLDSQYVNTMSDSCIRSVFNLDRKQLLGALPGSAHVRTPPIEHALVRPIAPF
jgi:hypothetical protein